jgi:hypothetical protein
MVPNLLMLMSNDAGENGLIEKKTNVRKELLLAIEIKGVTDGYCSRNL